MSEFDKLVPSAPAGRYAGVERPYTAADVEALRGSFPVSYTLAERGANKLWKLLHDEPYVNTLGAMTGNQAMQQVRAGLKAIYLSGWQVAADSNTAGAMYPDQSPLSGQRRAGAVPAASTAPCSAPTRSSMPKAARSATGSCPSSATRKPASAARSTASRS